MISLFGCSLLILVGLLCHQEVVTRYRPSLKLTIDALSPFRAPIGLLALGYGMYSTLQTLVHFNLILQAPFVYLSTLAFGLVAITAGGFLSYPLLRLFIARKLPSSSPLLEKLDLLHKNLETEQKTIGYSALALGIFHTLLTILPASMFGHFLHS